MANPIKHSESSVKIWGGEIEDYIEIHKKLDCSKKYFPDNRHRLLTHNMFFIFEVIIPLFGDYIENSSGRKVSTKDICERHILEDYRMRFIPTPQDWLENLNLIPWMQNGFGEPPSSVKLRYPDGLVKEKLKKTKLYVD